MMSGPVDTGLSKGVTGTITMECLPPDVVLDILSRLPVDSVLDCKLVCKTLLNLLSEQGNQFAKMHHQRQLLKLACDGDASSTSSTGLLFSFQKNEEDKTIGTRLYYGDKYNNAMNIHENFSHKNLQKTSISYPSSVGLYAIVGSCNGLICLIRYHHGIPDPIHICNPNTGEYLNLPEFTLLEEDYIVAFGFGYVDTGTSGEYKVVRVCYPNSEEYQNGEVQVYTIGSGRGWRTIGRTSYLLFSVSMQGISVNGALHWMEHKNIVAFNLADEEFRLIQLPTCYQPSRYNRYRLQALRGNLCLCHQRKEEHFLDIWSLKKNTTEASWSRDLSISYDSAKEINDGLPVMPLLITKKNELLFSNGVVLYCYDPKATTVMKLWDIKKRELMEITAIPHMKSFVSLKAMGEMSEIKKKKIEMH